MLCRYLIKPTHQILMIMLRMKLSGLLERSNQTCKRDRLFCPFIFQELPLMCVYSTLAAFFGFAGTSKMEAHLLFLLRAYIPVRKTEHVFPKAI